MLKANITKVSKWLAKLSPERFFLLVAGPLALALVVITPPFMVPDEPAHFFRAYQIAEGGFLPQRINEGVGGYLPKSLNDTSNAVIGDLPGRTNIKSDVNATRGELNRPLRPQERMEIHFENTALYSPLMYTPSALGIAVAKIFEPSPLVLFYIGRLFTALAWVGLAYLAIRLIPVAKWAFTVIAMAPMAIFQAASVSADALTLAISFVTIAWFMRLLQQPTPLALRDMSVTVGLLLTLGFVKQPYALIGGLFLLLPAKQFINKKMRWQFLAAAGGALFAATLLWASTSRSFFAQSPFMIDRVLQPTEQLMHILLEPLSFIKAILFTHFTGLGDGAIWQMIGVVGWLDTALPLWSVLLYLALLVIAAGQVYKERVAPGFYRLAFLGVAAMVVLAIDVLLYLYWNPFKSTIIGGIQGRYYLPILPLIVLACTGLYRVTFKKLKPELIIMGGLTITSLVLLAALLQRFY